MLGRAKTSEARHGSERPTTRWMQGGNSSGVIALDDNIVAGDVCKGKRATESNGSCYLRWSYLSSPDRKSPATDNNKVEVTLFRDMRTSKSAQNGRGKKSTGAESWKCDRIDNVNILEDFT